MSPLARPLVAPRGPAGASPSRQPTSVRTAAAPVFVLPVALNAPAEAALPLAVALAERLGADLHLVHVLEAGDAASTGAEARAHRARMGLDAMRMHYRLALPGRRPVNMASAVLTPASGAASLATYAATVGAALVVTSAADLRWNDGETHAADETDRAVPCPVLVVPTGRTLAALDRLVVVGARPETSVGTVTPAAVAAALALPLAAAAATPTPTDLSWIAPTR